MYVWPSDIDAKIKRLSSYPQNRDLFDDLKTHLHVRTQFDTASGYCLIASHKTPTCNVPLTPCETSVIPELLSPFYSSYGANAQFYSSSTNTAFHSRNQMIESTHNLPAGMVDFAYNPAGMGYLYVHTFDNTTQNVLTVCGHLKMASPQSYSTNHGRHNMIINYMEGDRNNHEVVLHKDLDTWYDTYKKWGNLIPQPQ